MIEKPLKQDDSQYEIIRSDDLILSDDVIRMDGNTLFVYNASLCVNKTMFQKCKTIKLIFKWEDFFIIYDSAKTQNKKSNSLHALQWPHTNVRK